MTVLYVIVGILLCLGISLLIHCLIIKKTLDD